MPLINDRTREFCFIAAAAFIVVIGAATFVGVIFARSSRKFETIYFEVNATGVVFNDTYYTKINEITTDTYEQKITHRALLGGCFTVPAATKYDFSVRTECSYINEYLPDFEIENFFEYSNLILNPRYYKSHKTAARSYNIGGINNMTRELGIDEQVCFFWKANTVAKLDSCRLNITVVRR